MTAPFGSRLDTAFAASGHLCVGIDPHPFLLADWGLADSPDGVREFGLRVVEAAAGRAAIIKPQVAFYERHGSAGFAALEAVFAAARAAGLVIIADVKRGDLGTSVEAYGQAWLSHGSTLEVDAMTVSAYQGVGSLDPVIDLAEHAGKGLFVLAATSNPEGNSLQTAVLTTGEHAGRTVAASIVAGVNSLNRAAASKRSISADGTGSFGVVLGATLDLADFGITPELLGTTPILAPGFGHQGARITDLRRLYGASAPRVIVSSSRDILRAGPGGVAAAIDSSAAELAEAFAA